MSAATLLGLLTFVVAAPFAAIDTATILALGVFVATLVIGNLLTEAFDEAMRGYDMQAAQAFIDSGDYDDAIRLANSGAVVSITEAPSFDRIAAIIAANEAARDLDQLDTGVPEGWGQ